MDAARSKHELTNRSANLRPPPLRSSASRSFVESVDSDYRQRVWVKLGDKPRLCPQCRSAATLPSHRRGVLETLLLTLLPIARPFRCMDCNSRFYGLLVNLRSIRPWFHISRPSNLY